MRQFKVVATLALNGSPTTEAKRYVDFDRLWEALSGLSVLLVVIVLMAFFGVTSHRFLSIKNLLGILNQMSVIGVLALGMTMVILIGGIDLSVGSVVLLSGAVSGTLIANYGFPAWLGVGAGLCVGAAIGLINGVLVERVRISPVIATLGTMIAVRGLGQIVLWINNSWVWITDPLFVRIAAGRFLSIPISAGIMLGLYVVMAIVLMRTRFGRYVYAVGGNRRAAHLCGLPVIRVRILVYVLAGCLAAVGGLLTAAELGVVGPSVGTGMEFDAIAAVVLGGARLSGGVGRVENTLGGAAILSLVLNYLTIRGVPDVWQVTVKGFIVLGAVLLDRLARRGE